MPAQSDLSMPLLAPGAQRCLESSMSQRILAPSAGNAPGSTGPPQQIQRKPSIGEVRKRPKAWAATCSNYVSKWRPKQVRWFPNVISQPNQKVDPLKTDVLSAENLPTSKCASLRSSKTAHKPCAPLAMSTCPRVAMTLTQ